MTNLYNKTTHVPIDPHTHAKNLRCFYRKRELSVNLCVNSGYLIQTHRFSVQDVSIIDHKYILILKAV